MRDRPMAVAAALGQAMAAEQGTNAAAMPEPPPMQERNAAAPALAPPAPHRPVELAESSPEPPQPGPSGPVPSGPVPAPLAAAAADSAAPVATAAAPPPPARQVAQVTIALAMGHGRAPRLTVALEPEALGRVEIRVERGAEGEAASVQILAERPETLALLQRDARELDRTLAQAGVVLASGGMQFGLSGDQGGQPQEQRPQQQGGGKGGDQARRAPPAAAGPVQATLSTLSLLDIAV
jgi:Meckel syndrome type 1 protein